MGCKSKLKLQTRSSPWALQHAVDLHGRRTQSLAATTLAPAVARSLRTTSATASEATSGSSTTRLELSGMSWRAWRIAHQQLPTRLQNQLVKRSPRCIAALKTCCPAGSALASDRPGTTYHLYASPTEGTKINRTESIGGLCLASLRIEALAEREMERLLTAQVLPHEQPDQDGASLLLLLRLHPLSMPMSVPETFRALLFRPMPNRRQIFFELEE